MIKKAILATAAVAGLCGLGAALLRPDWLPFFGTSHAVRQRAEQYWTARVAGDLKGMAPYVHPLQGAIQENSLLATDQYEITHVEVKGAEATVAVTAKYHLKMSQIKNIDREVTSNDPWVLYQGQWYHALHPVGFGEILAQGLGKWKPPTAPKP